ncbi:uncharacterized protein BDZ99DRAFT_139635 [Mytilinidion resinicola]|uniref:ABM domain-containing protein n=1 Tax=Mytilinidion resinicola TaxID=574789 RepID=A0A6A6Z662_9PEZI|nr:uncharacterized protein BDZ99DRAFT_139635 [Mytilinidion resinicola]KAF2816592.1 hypothetical protein BDZ99DRAFT_139635 [Mytilinidion resinicola]
MSKAVQLVTTLTPMDGKKDDVLKIITDMAVEVEEQEAGCLGVDVMWHDDTDTFILVERFKDQAAFEFHFKQPYVVAFKKSPVALTCLEAMDVKICSVAPGTFSR